MKYWPLKTFQVATGRITKEKVAHFTPPFSPPTGAMFQVDVSLIGALFSIDSRYKADSILNYSAAHSVIFHAYR